MEWKRSCLFFVFEFVVLSVQAMTIDRSTVVDDIEATFSRFYAPNSWKVGHCGFDLSKEIEKLKGAQTLSSNIDFQKAVKHFFISPRDYHVSVLFANTASSSLPVSIMNAENGFYLAYIADSVKNNFPLKPGDQITHFNDKPIAEIAAELMGNIQTPSLTDWAKAAMKLTQRSGIMGDPVEKGPVVIKAKRANEEVFAEIAWDYHPNVTRFFNPATNSAIAINNAIISNVPKELGDCFARINEHISSRPISVLAEDFWQETALNKATNPLALAQRESFFGKLSDYIVWETAKNSRFHAYIYRTESKDLVGFIRIPSYMPDGTQGSPSEFAKEFGEIISRMNDMTEVLVIDQQNNPGGSLFYLYALASMLTDKPLHTPQHQFTIDSKVVWEADSLLKQWDLLLQLLMMVSQPFGDIAGYPIDHQFFVHMKNYYQFIIEQWEAQKTLTDPYFLYGVDYIQPHPHFHYTKKILLLVNELDFSGGDFFPAILQDNHRATLLGTPTAGAGGYVLSHDERNLVGILGYRYTGSLALRKDKNPIENLGITPEVSCPIIQEDLQTNFKKLKAKIKETVEDLINH